MSLLCFASPRAAMAGPPTVEGVVRGLEEYEKATFDSKSFLVRYQRVASADVTPTSYSGGYLLAEWTIAFQGDNWFLQRRFTQPGGSGLNPDDPQIPAEPHTNLLRNGLLFEWEGTPEREALLDMFDTGRNIFNDLDYFQNLSLDVGKYIARAARVEDRYESFRRSHINSLDHPFLPAFLKANSRRYRVDKSPVEIEGRQCWLVEWPDMDRFWVDAERGFTILRRQYRWGPGKPERFEYLNADFREVKPGLWLPYSQTVLRHADITAERSSLWGKVASRTEYRVNEMQIDEVPESVFQLRLPEGVWVADLVRNFRYVVSGTNNDVDPFEAPIVDAQAALRGRPWRLWIIAGNILIIFVLLVLLLRRNRHLRISA